MKSEKKKSWRQKHWYGYAEIVLVWLKNKFMVWGVDVSVPSWGNLFSSDSFNGLNKDHSGKKKQIKTEISIPVKFNC